MHGEALVFHLDSFKAECFLPVSWLGLALVQPPSTGGSVRKRPAFRPAPRLEYDDEEDEALILCRAI